jgi:four helix bundle protein
MLKPNNLNKSNDTRLRAYQFSLDVIELCSDLPNKKIYWSIGDQLLRSGTSIGANLIEAKASSSKKDFIKFYDIALKSANETEYWLNLLKDSKLEVSKEKLDKLISEADEICKMIGKSLITLKNKT